MKDDGFTVFDIETTGKRPWSSKLLVAGIGEGVHAGRRGWQMISALLGRPGVVVCHTSFDLRYSMLGGVRLHPGVEFHDTRVMAWLLHEEGPFDLEFLSTQYLGFTPPKPIVQRQHRVMFYAEAGLMPIEDVPLAEITEYNRSDLRVERLLYLTLRQELQAEGLWELFLRDEAPLSRLIAEMEATGIPFDLAGNETLRTRVAGEAEDLRAELIERARIPLNLRSPDQVGKYLYSKGTFDVADRVEVTDAMKPIYAGLKNREPGLPGDPRAAALNAARPRVLPPGFTAESVGRLYVKGHWTAKGRGLPPIRAKRKSGHEAVKRVDAGKKLEGREWSTSSTDLVMKNADDEWVQDFVLWRELDKLGGAFLAGFPDFCRDGRMYGTFAMTGTVTGRFTSSEPNLQQVPAHGRFGADVRGLFKGALALGDYSQLENRVTAHYSGDENLRKAYLEGIDLYGLAASILFGGEPSKEHPQRGLLKTTMLSLAYGAGYRKLAMLMTRGGYETDMDGAHDLIFQLAAAFPRMFAHREELVNRAIRDGYVKTIGGRYRRLEFSPGWDKERAPWVDEAGFVDVVGMFKAAGATSRDFSDPRLTKNLTQERQASNAIIQGSAADICAAGMLAAARAAEPGEYTTLVQVHDEVIWERGPAWSGDESLAKLQAAMEVGHGYELDLPLKFEPMEAASWAEKGVTQTGEGHVVKDRLAKARSEGMQARKASDYVADMRQMRAEGSWGSGDEKDGAKERVAKARAARLARREKVS